MPSLKLGTLPIKQQQTFALHTDVSKAYMWSTGSYLRKDKDKLYAQVLCCRQPPMRPPSMASS